MARSILDILLRFTWAGGLAWLDFGWIGQASAGNAGAGRGLCGRCAGRRRQALLEIAQQRKRVGRAPIHVDAEAQPE